ncbi:MAG: ATP-binding protein [Bacillota bacterium]
MYINRGLEKKVIEMSEQYPVVLVCGARQVGKSTMLNHIKSADRKYVSLDDFSARTLAVQDPELFLETYGTPILIDEIQRVPELLLSIKNIVDQYALAGKSNKGLFWLTGSQQFQMMKSVSDSLAGRVALLNLSGFSMREINGDNTEVFVPNVAKLKSSASIQHKDINKIYNRIFAGGMPRLITEQLERESYYSNYINTYLERDVRELSQVGNLVSFHNLLVYLSARTAQELNYADASKAIGVSSPTIKSWISILETSGIIFLLRPYSSNITKRIVKTPKLYFLDTGLCAYLSKWPNGEVLEAGAMSGAYLETYVVSEIVKSYYANGKNPDFYYYRDFDQKEIDLLFVDAESITPVEIKKNSYPSGADKNFSVLSKFNLKVNAGIVLCLCKEFMPVNREAWIYPISKI